MSHQAEGCLKPAGQVGLTYACTDLYSVNICYWILPLKQSDSELRTLLQLFACSMSGD